MSRKIIKEEKKVVTTTQEKPVTQTVQVPEIVQQMKQETNQTPRVITEQHIEKPDGSVTVIRKESNGNSQVGMNGNGGGVVGVDDVESKVQREKQQRKMEGAGTVQR